MSQPSQPTPATCLQHLLLPMRYAALRAEPSQAPVAWLPCLHSVQAALWMSHWSVIQTGACCELRGVSARCTRQARGQALSHCSWACRRPCRPSGGARPQALVAEQAAASPVPATLQCEARGALRCAPVCSQLHQIGCSHRAPGQRGPCADVPDPGSGCPSPSPSWTCCRCAGPAAVIWAQALADVTRWGSGAYGLLVIACDIPRHALGCSSWDLRSVAQGTDCRGQISTA